MKKHLSRIFFLLPTLAAGACASSPPAPDTAAINALPVVEIGQKAPPGTEYVLHLGAATDIPVRLNLTGSLLREEKETHTPVRLVKDVYLYKQWVSFDGRTWDARRKHINLQISTGMSPEGGIVNISVDDVAP